LGDTNISPGNYPVIIFGHGFNGTGNLIKIIGRNWSLMDIICFPTTEMSLTLVMRTSGEDLKFLAAQMQNQSEDEVYFIVMCRKLL
jgi:hypothetical protein